MPPPMYVSCESQNTKIFCSNLTPPRLIFHSKSQKTRRSVLQNLKRLSFFVKLIMETFFRILKGKHHDTNFSAVSQCLDIQGTHYLYGSVQQSQIIVYVVSVCKIHCAVLCQRLLNGQQGMPLGKWPSAVNE